MENPNPNALLEVHVHPSKDDLSVRLCAYPTPQALNFAVSLWQSIDLEVSVINPEDGTTIVKLLK